LNFILKNPQVPVPTLFATIYFGFSKLQ